MTGRGLLRATADEHARFHPQPVRDGASKRPFEAFRSTATKGRPRYGVRALVVMLIERAPLLLLAVLCAGLILTGWVVNHW